MMKILKKVFFDIVIVVVIFFTIVFLIFGLLKFYAKKESDEDKMQQSKILQLIDNCGNIKSVNYFSRSRENSFKYNITMTFTDGTMLSVGDIYLKDNILYYGNLFWIGNYTEPYMLYYDGEKISLENGLFKDTADPDIIEIYQKHNLSLFLEKKDCILDFLRKFPLIEKETFDKIYNDSYKEELINKFNLKNIYFISNDGTLNWIDDNVKWVVLEADLIYSRKKEY